MNKNVQYTKTHQWIKFEDDLAVIGITDYAQTQLGAIMFVNLPEAGDNVTAGESFAEVESTKVVAEVASPVSGTVAEINETLLDEPELLNDDPYENWLIKVKEFKDPVPLLSEEEYQAYLKQC